MWEPFNNNNVLKVFFKVPKELFVMPDARQTAYVDYPLVVGDGREMFSPFTIAMLLQKMEISFAHKVLVIASGTGYTAALCAGLATNVYALEEDKTLRVRAYNSLLDMNCQNVTLLEGKPEEGAEIHSPFDRIFVDAAVEYLPEVLFTQLSDGGKLAAVVKGKSGVLEATLFTKSGNNLISEVIFETEGKILTNFTVDEEFRL